MKTVLDRVPIHIEEGKSISLSLPEKFRTRDGLFLLVHNSLGETIHVTLQSEDGGTLSRSFRLEAFPSILVFPSDEQEKGVEYHAVSISCFAELEGTLTFRSKNPEHILRTYQQ